MEIINKPNRKEWAKLALRPVIDKQELGSLVADILQQVKLGKDLALKKFAFEFDEVNLNELIVSGDEIQNAVNFVSKELKEAIQLAKSNIEKFHASQKIIEKEVETSIGVKCWRKSVPIEKVGLYIPGGTAPLFSTILMLAIPAQLAGCKEIILCTPPSKNDSINSAILYTANLVGIKKIVKAGGAQAVGAMAYGTESVPQVNKIFGPGNQFVTKAKELVQQDGVAIDMPAGPSEVLVIVDDTCNPSFVASDLLSQAEHGEDSQVILLSDSEEVIKEVKVEIENQLSKLPRKEITVKALKNSKCILFNDIPTCIEFSNEYAPEHLIIASEKAADYVNAIVNAGSVFLGNYSCESAGDYASGTNHTLPTNGYARSYSGVSLDSFVKKITFQKIEREGILAIGPAIELMADAEELFAHKNAVTLRLNEIRNV